ncbi:MAG: DUF4054 domain-containing protein [Candidatus Marinimicrobia bacterium]|nr:DUF4054 domain-containing protein [Candidatus Neomarinimicrobiota bacterium]
MSFLIYTESPLTPPDGIRLEFIFLPPSGYSPVDTGNILWLINGDEQTDYTVIYGVDQITLTLGVAVAPPEITDTFKVYADSLITGSDSPSGDCPVDNFTNYTPGDFRTAYPQVNNYPGITDNILDAKIIQGSIYCNETKWGKYYCSGMGLITAHILSLEIDAGLFRPSGGVSDGGIGQSFSLGSSGAINSASAGSVSYSASIDNSKGGQIDEWLKSTGWGQDFLTMRSMITAPSATISRYNGIGISGM